MLRNGSAPCGAAGAVGAKWCCRYTRPAARRRCERRRGVSGPPVRCCSGRCQDGEVGLPGESIGAVEVTLLASVALMPATVPDSVSVAVPLAPALMLAPPASVTATVPLVTVSCVVTCPGRHRRRRSRCRNRGVGVGERGRHRGVGRNGVDRRVVWPTTFTVAVASCWRWCRRDLDVEMPRAGRRILARIVVLHA